jgi:hypothetical protein
MLVNTSDKESTKSRASSIFSTIGSIFQQSRTNLPVKKNQMPSPGHSMWAFATNFFVPQSRQDYTHMNDVPMNLENQENISSESNHKAQVEEP